MGRANIVAATGLPTAPSSPKQPSSDSVEFPPLLPHERLEPTSSHHHHLHTSHIPSSLTPPISSASSMHAQAAGETEVEAAYHDASPQSQSSQSRPTSSPVSPSRLRRHTLASNTLSSVVTKPVVSVHISNPASQSTSPAPAVAPRSSSRTSSIKEKHVLTKGVNRTQNTPPQTPRALSSNNNNNNNSVEHHAEEPATLGVAQVNKTDKNTRSSSGTANPTVVGNIKGTLSVSIVQGRGLRPSTAPYVVCIYQLNEDISDGPKGDAMDTRQEQAPDHEEDLARGVAMRRIGSDQGKGMAIPPSLRATSRQSSQTDIAKLRGSGTDRQVTEPVWKHQTTL